MDVVGWIAAGIGAATLAATVPVLVLTWRQSKRQTERSIVDWIATEPEPGVIRVCNQGLDTAHEVTVEVWDSHNLETCSAGEFARGDAREVVLEYRREHGPDDTTVARSPLPRVADEPPETHPLLEDSPAFREQRRRWETAKALQDVSDARNAEAVREAERQQVCIQVSWRSRLGVWDSERVNVSRSE